MNEGTRKLFQLAAHHRSQATIAKLKVSTKREKQIFQKGQAAGLEYAAEIFGNCLDSALAELAKGERTIRSRALEMKSDPPMTSARIEEETFQRSTSPRGPRGKSP